MYFILYSKNIFFFRQNRLNIIDGLHVVLITLMDDVFKSFKLILACQSFKKTSSEFKIYNQNFNFGEKSPS